MPCPCGLGEAQRCCLRGHRPDGPVRAGNLVRLPESSSPHPCPASGRGSARPRGSSVGAGREAPLARAQAAETPGRWVSSPQTSARRPADPSRRLYQCRSSTHGLREKTGRRWPSTASSWPSSRLQFSALLVCGQHHKRSDSRRRLHHLSAPTRVWVPPQTSRLALRQRPRPSRTGARSWARARFRGTRPDEPSCAAALNRLSLTLDGRRRGSARGTRGFDPRRRPPVALCLRQLQHGSARRRVATLPRKGSLCRPGSGS
jgi:hypothetical protein